MIFTKMQLNGNDFIYVNCLESMTKISANMVKEICDRKFGIGADGLILVMTSEKADYKIDIYNADGSKAKMCGNALLLLGKYLYDLENINLTIDDRSIIKVETCSGVKQININVDYDEVKSVTVNMGEANFDKYNDMNILVDININCVSVGNDHIVVIVDNIDDDIDINNKKELLMNLSDKFNIEFLQIINECIMKIKTFEIGVGETLSCGSGACAAVAVAVKHELSKSNIDLKIISKGGAHVIKYLDNGEILLTGEPKLVYNGYLRM